MWHRVGSCLFADIWRWRISSLFGRAWKEAKIPFWCCYLPSHVPQLKSHGCPREPLTWQLTHHVGDRFENPEAHNELHYFWKSIFIYRVLCPIHVVTFTLISNLATDYIQKRRGELGLFSFEYNLSPNLISK